MNSKGHKQSFIKSGLVVWRKNYYWLKQRIGVAVRPVELLRAKEKLENLAKGLAKAGRI